jgi:hypothetical protein
VEINRREPRLIGSDGQISQLCRDIDAADCINGASIHDAVKSWWTARSKVG